MTEVEELDLAEALKSEVELQANSKIDKDMHKKREVIRGLI